MRTSIQSALALLDEGLSIYRRHFGSFVLLAAIWFVPITIIIGLSIVALSWMSESQQVILGILGVLLLFPLLLYLLVILSRAAANAIDGQAINIRNALLVSPLRILSMTIFGLIYAIIAQVGAGFVLFACFCPMLFLGSFAFAGIASSSTANPIGSALAFFIGGVGYLLLNILTLMISGATFNSIIYALQPWAIERVRFGIALEYSINMLFYRIGTNLLVWSLASLIAGAAGLSVALLVGLAIPLPTIWLLGDDSRIAQAIAASAWLLGLTLVVPPLPIWMTLLYRRNWARREGLELAGKVNVWGNDETMKR